MPGAVQPEGGDAAYEETKVDEPKVVKIEPKLNAMNELHTVMIESDIDLFKKHIVALKEGSLPHDSPL